MTSTLEDLVRARAHEIWEREGRPLGREAEHWEQARREIKAQQYGRDADPEATRPDERPEKGRSAAASGGSGAE